MAPGSLSGTACTANRRAANSSVRARRQRGPYTNAPWCRAPSAQEADRRPPPPRSPPQSWGASRSGSRPPAHRAIRSECPRRNSSSPISQARFTKSELGVCQSACLALQAIDGRARSLAPTDRRTFCVVAFTCPIVPRAQAMRPSTRRTHREYSVSKHCRWEALPIDKSRILCDLSKYRFALFDLTRWRACTHGFLRLS
jgi:hypothetical protein